VSRRCLLERSGAQAVADGIAARNPHPQSVAAAAPRDGPASASGEWHAAAAFAHNVCVGKDL